MTRPDPATFKFWIVTALVLPFSVVALALMWPPTLGSAHSQSAALTTAGRTADGGEALTDFQLATWLNSNNQAAYAGLAKAQIAAGQPTRALASLQHAGQGSDITALRVRTLIELGRYPNAAAVAAHLTGPSATTEDLTLAAFAFALAGRTADIQPLVPRVTSPQAAERVQRAQANKLTLAAELSSSGLLNSSSALLRSLPASYERNLMLARIYYTHHTKSQLSQAVSLLNQAVNANPAALPARRLLAAVYTDQGNQSAASAQNALIAKLQSGRP